MSREPDASRLDVEIGQVVDETGLKVVLDEVDDDSIADVDDLHVGEVTLGLVNCLVDLLVVPDAVAKVFSGFLWVLTDVVGRCGLHFEDVGHDEVFVVAFALHEEVKEVRFDDLVIDPLASRFGRVCSIEDGNFVGLILEPVQHVSDCSFCGSSPSLFALRIVDVEKLGIRVRIVGSSVFPNVEDLSVD